MERMIFVPSGDNQATTQMLINDEAETSILNVLRLPGCKGPKPESQVMVPGRPIWGPPDGCVVPLHAE